MNLLYLYIFEGSFIMKGIIQNLNRFVNGLIVWDCLCFVCFFGKFCANSAKTLTFMRKCDTLRVKNFFGKEVIL